MTKRLIDHGEATRKKAGHDPGASNLEPEVRISSRPGWQNQPTDQRPDTFTQAKTSPRDLQPRGGPYIFSELLFQRRDIEHLPREHLLQLGVLSSQCLQTPRVGHLHAAILRPPLVKGRIADPMLAAKFLCARPGLMLLQNANDLFFAETASLHRLSPRLENRPTLNAGLCRGAGQDNSRFKKIVANLMLNREMLQGVIPRKT